MRTNGLTVGSEGPCREEGVDVDEPEDLPPTALLQRASLVLDALAEPTGMTLSQIARWTGLPRSSTHRILDSLIALGWARRQGQFYRLGIRMIELGAHAVGQDRVRRAAISHMQDLYRATRLVVHLAVLDGSGIVLLEKVGGFAGIDLPTRVGDRRPASETALGRVLLAHSSFGGSLSVQERRGILSRGFCSMVDDPAPGFGCIAAPVGSGRDVVAALSICAPYTVQFNKQLAHIVQVAAVRILHSYTGYQSGVHGVKIS